MIKATPASPAAILDYYFRTRAGRPSPARGQAHPGGLRGGGQDLPGEPPGARPLRPQGAGDQGHQDHPVAPHVCPDGEDIRLHVWDFGGQEIMHATHQFFLTRRSLYLLVLNGRQGQEEHDADYWLNLIQSFGGDSPVIVVLNKIKAHPFDVNRRGLRQKFPEIADFVATDCEDGTGLDELRQLIQQETDRLPGLRDAFPASLVRHQGAAGRHAGKLPDLRGIPAGLRRVWGKPTRRPRNPWPGTCTGWASP